MQATFVAPFDWIYLDPETLTMDDVAKSIRPLILKSLTEQIRYDYEQSIEIPSVTRQLLACQDETRLLIRVWVVRPYREAFEEQSGWFQPSGFPWALHAGKMVEVDCSVMSRIAPPKKPKIHDLIRIEGQTYGKR